MKPKFTLKKIKYGIDSATFQRAVDLYENNKVTEVKNDGVNYSALILGTKPYKVFVSQNRFDSGGCECYLGQRDVLCKHIIALAIYALKKGEKIKNKEKQITESPEANDEIRELTKEEIQKIKKNISFALRFIKAYKGPSKYWFQYQNSLTEGTRRLSEIINSLPVGIASAKLLVNLLLRLDKKLSYGGVDDSDGTVGDFIYQTVEVLKDYQEKYPKCVKEFEKFCDITSCFDWEKELVEIYNNNSTA